VLPMRWAWRWSNLLAWRIQSTPAYQVRFNFLSFVLIFVSQPFSIFWSVRVVSHSGDPADLARVLCALLDGTSSYCPGDLIYCDNDATYLANARYRKLYNRGNGEEGIEASEVRDYCGNLGYKIRRGGEEDRR
jgi:hypothetical protein